MKPFVLACAGAALLLSTGTQAQTARVDQLAWLSGCWGFDTPDGRYEEYWSTPSGNSILGMSRRIADGYTKEFEYLRIVTSGGGGFTFVAQPQGNPETRFTMESMRETRLVFENPEHDFPQKIIYEYTAPDSLNARIEGKNQGRPTVLRFPMKRRPCP